jgi:hypothetical protein
VVVAFACPLKVTVAPLTPAAPEMVQVEGTIESENVFNVELAAAVEPAVAVMVADCVDVTAAAVAVNPTLVAAVGTLTLAGTVRLVLLLARVTPNPPDAAGALKVTVQATDPGEPTVPDAHETELSEAESTIESANVLDVEPAVAVMVADCVDVTVAAVAVNPTLFAAAGTLTFAGTVRLVLLLASVTPNPPVAAGALNVTVQATDPAEPTVPDAHETELSEAESTIESANVLDVEPAVAVMVAACVDVTVAAVAVNPTLVAAAGTLTFAGTVKFVLLLASVTPNPPVAAGALKVTVQATDPGEPTEADAHETELSEADGTIESANVLDVEPAVAVMVADCVDVTVAAVAVNPTLVAAAGTLTLAGTIRLVLLLASVTPNPPVAAGALKVTVQATDPGEPTEAEAHETELSEAESTIESANVLDVEPAVAVIVADCVDVTAAAVAVNPTLVAAAGTLTFAGTVRLVLLLASVTPNPPVAAGALKVTVQATDPGEPTELDAHETELSEGKGTIETENVCDVEPAVAVMVADCVDVTAAAVAVNPTLVAAAGTLTLAGTVKLVLLLASVTPNPPVAAGALKVTVQATDPGEPTEADAHDTELSEADGTIESANVLDVEPAVAVMVADCVDVTAAAVAVNPTLVAAAGTLTFAGTVRLVLLLPSVTPNPPVAAGALKVTVQANDPGEPTEADAHETELSEGVTCVTEIVPPLPNPAIPPPIASEPRTPPIDTGT